MGLHRRTRSTALYYGWIITLTLAVTETVSWGILHYAFSVFLTPMERELGWSRAELTGGFSLSLLVMGAMAFPVGAWIDRHGPRLLMTLGSIAASLLVVAWSRVTDLTTFYLIWAGIGVCAAAVLYEPAFAVIATWFTRKRGRALAIITFAAGLASTIFVPLSDVLLNAVGWRDATLYLGVLLAVTTILPHALILRRRPADLGLFPDGEPNRITSDAPPVSVSLSGALHNRFFWMLTAAFTLSFLAASAIRVHFIPFLIDSGIDASSAAVASGAIGIMQVVGRVFFAPLEARYSARAMVTGVFVMQAASMLILLAGPSVLIIGAFLIIFGTSFGAKTLARAAVIADLFGASHFGRISSVNSIFLTVAATLAPVGAGLLYDATGSYDLVLWLAVGLAAASAAVMVFSRPEAARSTAHSVR
ncbi:MAG TPA: MFS transporter [Aggregatilineales bacterium]|jgi:MFS family permease|nr:MFS transporter [Aggregatilineales bacterium]